MITMEEQILGGIWGLLVGDAVGVPYEFHYSDELKDLSYIDIKPPETFKRSYKNIPIGVWSDDGAQALCLLDTLTTCNSMDIDDFATRLLKWYDDGYLAVDNMVFDVGIQTAEAIRAFKSGVLAKDAGFVRPEGKGNGSLMRVLPLALWHKGTDKELIEDAHKQSMVTHGNPCNQVCCALYCLWVRGVINGLSIEKAYSCSVKILREAYPSNSDYTKELEGSIRPDEEIPGTGSGYVVDSLRSAKMVLKHNTYEDVIKAAILLGDDTDTTAAIAGGIAGVRDGINGIPERWLNQMKGKDLVQPLLEKLIEN
jgi:ADP-ribosylglycohydrolase